MLVFNIYCGEKARACCFIVEDCEEIPLPRLAVFVISPPSHESHHKRRQLWYRPALL